MRYYMEPLEEYEEYALEEWEIPKDCRMVWDDWGWVGLRGPGFTKHTKFYVIGIIESFTDYGVANAKTIFTFDGIDMTIEYYDSKKDKFPRITVVHDDVREMSSKHPVESRIIYLWDKIVPHSVVAAMYGISDMSKIIHYAAQELRARSI